MKFESFAAFIQMDGHGLYIWLAYGITFMVILANLWWPAAARRRFIRIEKRVLARDGGSLPEGEESKQAS